jgi:hypothetical protein
MPNQAGRRSRTGQQKRNNGHPPHSAIQATDATTSTVIRGPSHTGNSSLPKGEEGPHRDLDLDVQVSTTGCGPVETTSAHGLQGSVLTPIRVKGPASKNNSLSARPGTRSSGCKLVSAFEWEALHIAKHRLLPDSTGQANLVSPIPDQKLDAMSRNRPRGPPTSRDNGLAANEETDMWNKIIQDLRKAKEKNDKQKALSEQIASLNEKIAKEGNSK